MPDLLLQLPQWLTAASIPASAVMTFFWKGDEALSVDFKDWMARKLRGRDSKAQNISYIDPVGSVFAKMYKVNPRGLPSISRVFLISIASFVVIIVPFLMFVGNDVDFTTWKFLFKLVIYDNFIIIVISLLQNIMFDYVSVAKAIALISALTKSNIKYKTAIYIIADFSITMSIVLAYYFTSFYTLELYSALIKKLGLSTDFIILPTVYYMAVLAYIITTLNSVFLTAIFAASARISKVWHYALWILPVNSLPIRSIGIIAGILTFFGGIILHAVGFAT